MKQIPSKRIEENGSSLRSIWTPEEDKLLTQLVSKYNGKKWDLVAQAISSQSTKKAAKQCRERWHTRLNPAISTTAWSREEETRLLELHKVLGNKWSEIAEKLPGRTDNAVKNWFFCRLRKLLRSVKNAFIDINFADTKSVEQLAYLLNYLYAYYISPEHKVNIQKIICPRIIGRTNQGDKYLRSMLEDDPSMIFRFQRYTEFLLLNISSSIKDKLCAEYPEIFESKVLVSNSLSDPYCSNFLDSSLFGNFL